MLKLQRLVVWTILLFSLPVYASTRSHQGLDFSCSIQLAGLQALMEAAGVATSPDKALDKTDPIVRLAVINRDLGQLPANRFRALEILVRAPLMVEVGTLVGQYLRHGFGINSLRERLDVILKPYEIFLKNNLSDLAIPEMGDDSDHCFTGRMRVLMTMQQGYRRMDQLQPGDEVVSYDTVTHKFVSNEVDTIFSTFDQPFMVRTDNRRLALEVTGGHPFYSLSRADYVSLDSLGPADTLSRIHNISEASAALEPISIESLTCLPGASGDVWNLRVKNPPHNYFVEGYLVHNKGGD